MALRDEILADSPFLYYEMQETGLATCSDSSGNSRHGTYVNSPSVNQGSLLARDINNKSVLFTKASSRYVNSNSVVGTSFTALTVEALVKPASFTGYQAIAGQDRSAASGDPAWTLKATENGASQFRFHIHNGTSVLTALSASAYGAVGTVYHVVGVWDGTSMYLYVDGILRAKSACTAMAPVSSNAVVGAGYFNDVVTDYFDGYISHFAVYNTALTRARVLEHYAQAQFYVTLTKTETSPIVDWVAEAHRCDTGASVGRIVFDTATVKCPCGGYNGPVTITMRPEVGAQWATTTAKVVGEYGFPTNLTATPRIYQVTTAGSTGNGEPTWPTSGTVTDSSVVWTHVSLLEGPISNGPLIPV